MENVRYILQQNRSYLRWTYDELAFPVLSMNPMASASNQTSWSNRFAEVKVPAVRPHLDCRLISGKDVQRNLTLSDDDPDDNKIYIEPAVGICDPSASPDNTSAIRLKYTSLESCFGTFDSHPCSDHMFTWGRVGKSSIEHIALLACNETVEEVYVETRLQLPNFDIDPSNPPIPDESSARLTRMYLPEYGFSISMSYSSTLDKIWQLAVSDQGKIPLEDLGRAEANGKVADAIAHVRRLMTAQAFGNSTRMLVNETLTDAPLPATITNPGRFRLIQDASSTRALEAVLGTMLVLAMVATTFLNTDHVLPKSPCSIAAVASLLADSNILERYSRRIKVSTETPVYDELKEGGGMFADCRFHLGWFEDDGRDAESGTEHPNGVENHASKFGIYIISEGDSTSLISDARTSHTQESTR